MHRRAHNLRSYPNDSEERQGQIRASWENEVSEWPKDGVRVEIDLRFGDRGPELALYDEHNTLMHALPFDQNMRQHYFVAGKRCYIAITYETDFTRVTDRVNFCAFTMRSPQDLHVMWTDWRMFQYTVNGLNGDAVTFAPVVLRQPEQQVNNADKFTALSFACGQFVELSPQRPATPSRDTNAPWARETGAAARTTSPSASATRLACVGCRAVRTCTRGRRRRSVRPTRHVPFAHIQCACRSSRSPCATSFKHHIVKIDCTTCSPTNSK